MNKYCEFGKKQRYFADYGNNYYCGYNNFSGVYYFFDI